MAASSKVGVAADGGAACFPLRRMEGRLQLGWRLLNMKAREGKELESSERNFAGIWCPLAATAALM